MVKMVISEVQQQTADIQAFCQELIEGLTEVVEATQSVTLIDSWKGKAADSMKDYLGRVYPAACRAMIMFTEEYAEANQTYLNAYISRFGTKDTDSEKLKEQLRQCEQLIRNCEADIERIEYMQRTLSIAERTALSPLFQEALETNYRALERNHTLRDTVQRRLDDFMAFDAQSPSFFEGLDEPRGLMNRTLGALGINIDGEVERSNWNGSGFSGYNTNWISTVDEKWEDRTLRVQKEKAKELKKEFETELAGRYYAPVQFQNATVYMWVKDPNKVTPKDIQFNEKFKAELNQLLPKHDLTESDPLFIAAEELRTGINHFTGEKLTFWEKFARASTIASNILGSISAGVSAGKMQSIEYTNVPKVSKITKNGKTYSLKRNKETGKYNYKVLGAIHDIPLNSLAKDIAGSLNGKVNELKNGFKVTVPTNKKPIIIRIMKKGSGGREKPYYRISIDGKGSLTSEGKISSDRGLTHIDISNTSLEEIKNIINNYLRQE